MSDDTAVQMATATEEKQSHHDRAFQLAVAAGCQPFWHDGILGFAWHCGCPDDGPTHFIDQQCSVVKFYKKFRDYKPPTNRSFWKRVLGL